MNVTQKKIQPVHWMGENAYGGSVLWYRRNAVKDMDLSQSDENYRIMQDLLKSRTRISSSSTEPMEQLLSKVQRCPKTKSVLLQKNCHHPPGSFNK